MFLKLGDYYYNVQRLVSIYKANPRTTYLEFADSNYVQLIELPIEEVLDKLSEKTYIIELPLRK